ncbi:MAG: ABC transporter permease [Chloroflexi bacterium]|nr:ABC transporter permease [Chloroflexota bacterium]
MNPINVDTQAPGTLGRSEAALAYVRRGLVGFWDFSRKKPLGGISAVLLIFLLIIAIFANVIAPNDPVRIFIGSSFAGAGHTPEGGNPFLFGADSLGRDLFSRLVFGARISLLVGVGSVVVGGVAGTLVGLFSAYYGGRLDLILQRFVDGLMAFPALVLALLILTVLGPGFTIFGAQGNVMLSIAIILIPLTARVVRATTLSVKENVYVDAAKAIGASDWQIMYRHILPNITHAIIIIAATFLGAAIIVEATLSFLGAGTDISQPSWGNMLSSSRALFESHPSLLWGPALSISLTVLAFNMLGDALRDVWDPRLRNT